MPANLAASFFTNLIMLDPAFAVAPSDTSLPPASIASAFTDFMMLEPQGFAQQIASVYAHKPGAKSEARSRGDIAMRMQATFPSSPVRVHADAKAGAVAQALHAEAFTIGRDIFFAPGRFDLSAPRGMALMGHELVHAKQHETAPDDFHKKSANPAQHASFEREALAAESMILSKLTAPDQPEKEALMEFAAPQIITREDGVMRAEEGRAVSAPSASPISEVMPEAAPAMPPFNVEQMAEQVYQIIERKLREEKAMRGD